MYWKKNNWANMKMSDSCYWNNKNVMETNSLYLWCSQWPFLIIGLWYQENVFLSIFNNPFSKKEILHLFFFHSFYLCDNHSLWAFKNFCNSNSNLSSLEFTERMILWGRESKWYNSWRVGLWSGILRFSSSSAMENEWITWDQSFPLSPA